MEPQEAQLPEPYRDSSGLIGYIPERVQPGAGTGQAHHFPAGALNAHIPGEVAWHPLLCGNAFNNEMAYVSSLARMLERNCTDIALGIHIKNGVFIQISGFRYVGVAEPNVQRVRIVKVADFHGPNALSKNALCAASPSGSKITRR